jgi:hypothetical protein
MNITTTPALLPIGADKIPLIQNLGPEPVFISRSNTNMLTTGIKLNAGDAFETANEVRQGGTTLYAVTASGSSDVRIITSG